MFGKIFLILYVLAQILVSVLTEYSIKNSKFFSSIGGFLGIFIVGPLIKNMMRRIGPKKAKIVCCVLIALFVLDIICCTVFGPNLGEGIGREYAGMNIHYLFITG